MMSDSVGPQFSVGYRVMKFSAMVTKIGSAARAADVVVYATLERVSDELHAVLFRKRLSPRSRARPTHVFRENAPSRPPQDKDL